MVVGLLLTAVPLYVFYRLKTPLLSQAAIALVRMTVQMALIGVYLHYLFTWNNAWINILWVVVMVIVASFTALKRTRLRWQTALLPLAAGFFCSAVVVGLYLLFIVLRLSNPFDSRYFIPIMGILLGNMLSVAVVTLTSYYDSLCRETPLYYYLLGNGATHMEAITPFLKKANFRFLLRRGRSLKLCTFTGRVIIGKRQTKDAVDGLRIHVLPLNWQSKVSLPKTLI